MISLEVKAKTVSFASSPIVKLGTAPAANSVARPNANAKAASFLWRFSIYFFSKRICVELFSGWTQLLYVYLRTYM